MPSGGNRQKPTRLHVIEGTFRPDRAPKKEVAPRPVRSTDPPEDLDRYARKFWTENAPIIQRLGLLTEADLPSWRSLCLASSRYERANVRLRWIYQKRKASHDEIRQEEISVERAEFSLRQLWAEFGMTPAARSRLDVYAPPPENEEDDFARKYLSGPSA